MIRSRPVSGSSRGFSLLLVVIVFGAVALFVGVSLTLRGIREGGLTYGVIQAAKAQAIADGCLEEAIEELELDDTYTGTPSFAVGTDGSCSIEITNPSPDVKKRSIDISAQAGTWTRDLTVAIKLLPHGAVIEAWARY